MAIGVLAWTSVLIVTPPYVDLLHGLKSASDACSEAAEAAHLAASRLQSGGSGSLWNLAPPPHDMEIEILLMDPWARSSLHADAAWAADLVSAVEIAANRIALAAGGSWTRNTFRSRLVPFAWPSSWPPVLASCPSSGVRAAALFDWQLASLQDGTNAKLHSTTLTSRHIRRLVLVAPPPPSEKLTLHLLSHDEVAEVSGSNVSGLLCGAASAQSASEVVSESVRVDGMGIVAFTAPAPQWTAASLARSALHLTSQLFGIDAALLQQTMHRQAIANGTSAEVDVAGAAAVTPDEFLPRLQLQAAEHHARLASRRLTLAHAMAQRPRAIVGPEPLRLALLARDRCREAVTLTQQAGGEMELRDTVELTSSAASLADAATNSHQLTQRASNSITNLAAAIVPIAVSLLLPVLVGLKEACQSLPRVREPEL